MVMVVFWARSLNDSQGLRVTVLMRLICSLHTVQCGHTGRLLSDQRQ